MTDTVAFSFDGFCERCDCLIRCREHIGTLCVGCGPKNVLTQQISDVRPDKLKARRPAETGPGLRPGLVSDEGVPT